MVFSGSALPLRICSSPVITITPRADVQRFSLHAAVRCVADDRNALEQLRHITCPALAYERTHCNVDGRVVLKPKTAWRNDNTHLVMSPLEFLQRLAVLMPRVPRVARPRLIRTCAR
jgi:hypothetical protein